MNPRFILFFGAIVSLAIVVLSWLWVPYGDTGTSDAAIAHFSAAGGTILVVLACFGYMSWQAMTKGTMSSEKSYPQIVMSYFLVAAVIVTSLLFVRTYAGLSYKVFWTTQIIQYCALLGIWMVTGYVGRSSDGREGTARVTGYRKQSAADELDNVVSRLASFESGEAKALLKAVGSVREELKFLPNYVDGPFAAEIFPSLRAWIDRATDAASLLPRSVESGSTPDPRCIALVEEAASLRRKIASWKRS